MRLQRERSPDAMHRGGRHTRCLRHAPRAPMRGVDRLRLKRAYHDLLDAVVADLAWRAASGLVVETVEPVPGEALTPGLDSLSGHADRLGDPAVVEAISRPQYDLRS